METKRIKNTKPGRESYKSNGFHKVLTETVNSLSKANHNVFDSLEGRALASSPILFNDYVKHLAEGLDATDTSIFIDVMNNSQKHMIWESANMNVFTPYVILTGPVFRHWGGATPIKNIFPIEVPTMDYIEHEIRHDYIIDTLGEKHELIDYFEQQAADISNYSPAGRVKIFADYIPLTTLADVNLITGKTSAGVNAPDLPVGFAISRHDVDGKESITRKLYVVGAKMLLPIGRDHTVDLVTYNSAKDVLVQLSPFEITMKADGTLSGEIVYTTGSTWAAPAATDDFLPTPAGTVYKDTIVGTINRDNNTVSFGSIHQQIPSNTTANGYITAGVGYGRTTHLKLTTHVSNFSSKIELSTTFDFVPIRKVIDEGTRISATVAPEYIIDFANHKGIDPTQILTENMSKIFEIDAELRAIKFITETFTNKGFAAKYLQTFDARPSEKYTGANPRDIVVQSLQQLVDKMTRQMKSDFKYPGGYFVLIGHPDTIQLLGDVRWTYQSSDGERSGVAIEGIQIGSYKSNVTEYHVVSAFSWTKDQIDLVFFPTGKDEITMLFAPYYYFATSSKDGVLKHGEHNIPNFGYVKRDDFLEFNSLLGRITVTNNSFADLVKVKPAPNA